MPISDKHKLIFVHIPKCAGISIWTSLDLDIVPENLISTSMPVLQHLLPKQLKESYIDKKRWNSYKKFTVIRNPYDRVVSDYFWMKDHASHLVTGSFDDFLTLREDVVLNDKYDLDMHYDHFYPMYFYFENIKYDHVIRFEKLEEEYEALRKQYDITSPLPKMNESFRNDFQLNKEQEERIYKLYKKDFTQFGYKRQRLKSGPVRKPVVQETLKKTKVKIYWGAVDLQFTEDCSLSNVVELEAVPTLTSFQIPQNGSIHFLQVEIGNEIDLLNIHEIILKNDSGVTLWTWDKYNTHYKKDLFLIENKKYWDGKVIQVPTSNRPFFIFPIDHLQSEETKYFSVDVVLSALDDQQLSILDTVTSPLSYISELEHENLRSSLTNIYEQNHVEVESYKKTINDLKIIQSQTSTSLEFFTKEIGDVINEKENLVSEKRSLLQQFDALQEKHHIVFTEKEEVENQKTYLESQLKEAHSQLEALSAEKKSVELNFENEAKIKDAELLQKNDQLAELKSAFNEASERNRLYAVEIEAATNKINDLNNFRHQTLSSLDHIKQEVQRLLSEKELLKQDLENNISSLGNQLAVMHTRHEELEREKVLKDSKIKWFEDTYEKRSILGIIKDRLFPQKRSAS